MQLFPLAIILYQFFTGRGYEVSCVDWKVDKLSPKHSNQKLPRKTVTGVD